MGGANVLSVIKLSYKDIRTKLINIMVYRPIFYGGSQNIPSCSYMKFSYVDGVLIFYMVLVLK